MRPVGSTELGKDDLGELLAELDAELIEAVDVPDDSLYEDLVLIERDQSAERSRREALQHESIAWTIAGKGLVRH